MCGKTVVESAGPTWRLVGSVKLDKLKRNHLTFSRRNDPLSSRVKAAGNQLLPTVQLTDSSGKIYQLTNAQIAIRNLTPPHGTRRSSGASTSSQHNTNLLEQYSFVFQKIAIENPAGSTSTTDDWNQSNS
jgi:hypothetical protein